jgi:hypothetical protein
MIKTTFFSHLYPRNLRMTTPLLETPQHDQMFYKFTRSVQTSLRIVPFQNGFYNMLTAIQSLSLRYKQLQNSFQFYKSSKFLIASSD